MKSDASQTFEKIMKEGEYTKILTMIDQWMEIGRGRKRKIKKEAFREVSRRHGGFGKIEIVMEKL